MCVKRVAIAAYDLLPFIPVCRILGDGTAVYSILLLA